MFLNDIALYRVQLILTRLNGAIPETRGTRRVGTTDSIGGH